MCYCYNVLTLEIPSDFRSVYWINVITLIIIILLLQTKAYT